VRFKPDGSAFEQYASRGGNTWGLDITSDGQVFYTQPTSGNHFIHVVLPEYVLAKGKLPGVMGTNGMLPKEPTYPAMHWEQQAYVQIDQVGSYTAAAGCAIYEGGAWPAKWNYSYFTTEPTLNIVSHFMVEPDGVTYKAKREPGREQTEFIRSQNLWFRPIENRVGPDGALYVVDFCNQAVIHNDTRGPTHGPANAAVRPDRDHYYGRIWKVQHKEAKKVEVVKMEKIESLQQGHVQLRQSFSSNNKHQRANALRLLAEKGGHEEWPLPGNVNSFVDSQINSSNAATDKDIDGASSLALGATSKQQGLMRMYAAISRFNDVSKVRASALKKFGSEDCDQWTRSLIIAAASRNPSAFINDALALENSESFSSLIEALIPISLKLASPTDSLEKLIAACAADSKAEALKITILRTIAQQLGEVPTLTPALTEALKRLLSQPSLAAATLPLVTKWDKSGVLAAEVKAQLDKLSATLSDNAAPVELRVSAAKGLVAVGGASQEYVVRALARPEMPAALQSAIVAALDESGGVEAIVPAFGTLKREQQTQAFEAMLKRPEATGALLDAVKAGSIDRAIFAPGDVARLRSHPNKQIAKRANDLFKVNNAAKDAIIAKLVPEVEKPGNAAQGKMLFTAACAICHKLGDIGVAVGPPLDGMGAHGPAELLVHIVDPNREVDPSFWAFNITTKKGETLVGVVTSENSATVTLATQVGVREIAKSDIDKRENTRRSLMPEGLDALGPEPLRDILAFICGDAMKQFRILHLADAFTADSRDGLFASSDPRGGQREAHQVRQREGRRRALLHPGPREKLHRRQFDRAQRRPRQRQPLPNLPREGRSGHQRRREASAAPQRRLRLGLARRADEAPALKATVVYEGGEKEEFTFLNGIHFSDYIRPVEVPGSKGIEGLADGQEPRLLTLELTKKGIAKTLILESPAGNKNRPLSSPSRRILRAKAPAL
jgi:putative heme-binding domain-containing protein